MLDSPQRQVATVFLGLPEAQGFALAGGAALILREVVQRETKDLDFFTPDPKVISAAAAALEEAAADRGWHVDRVRSHPSFVRLLIRTTHGDVLVELAHDFRLQPAENGSVGAVLSIEELGADKLLALFGRAEPRDFVDVYFLAQRLGIDRMLELAASKDTGFDPYRLAIGLASLRHRSREEFRVDDDTWSDFLAFYDKLRRDLMDRTVEG